tara:strand:+ start:75755 stop:77125 length:1371 start_codon:yes stop_codon:yes gene_type:complete
MRTVDEKLKITAEDEKIIKRINSDEKLREMLEKQLSKLSSTESFYIAKLFQDKFISAPSWYRFLPFLSIFSLVSILSLPFSTVMVYVVPVLVIINMGIHYKNKNNLDHYISSLPELVKMHAVAKFISEFDPRIFNASEIRNSLRSIEKIKKHFYLFQMENRLQGDISNLSWGLVEIIKILLILEPIMFFKALRRINDNQNEIASLYHALGRIDMLYSISSLRKGLDVFCIPDLLKDEEGLTAKSIYHPLIEDCVENEIRTLDKSVLLTGSNMSGKTTFIRTIGVNIITANSLNTCFADSIQLPKMRLMSAIRISDDLMDEKSYYFEEVSRLKEIIDSSEQEYKYIFLLDEIFKGTNTIERVSAGKAVLSYLAANSNLIFVSTHDIELTDFLREEYNLYHFSEVITNDRVDFDYKLKEGKLKTRNAIRILEINQYPKVVIKEAESIAEKFDVKKPHR